MRWIDIIIRTEAGTVLKQASLERFRYELEHWFFMQRTGVWDMSNSTGWQHVFLTENKIDVLKADIAKIMTMAEKDLTAYIKQEREGLEAEEKTRKQGEKALHKAFDLIGGEANEASREAILAVAMMEMKVDPSKYAKTMDSLKELVKVSPVFYIGHPPTFLWGRLENAKGEATGNTKPAARGSAGPAVNGAAMMQRFTSGAKKLGFHTKQEFLRAKVELGVGEKGYASVEQLQTWLAKQK